MTNHTHQPHEHLTERVLGRIENEHVTPRPRWEFIVKNYFFWIFGALAVVFGALAVAATLFEIVSVDWHLAGATNTDFLAFFFAAAPFFWVAALALFILVGYLNIRCTNHGYRYPLVIIALGAVLMALALGSAFYMTGFGRAIEEIVDGHTPFHRPILRSIHDRERCQSSDCIRPIKRVF